MANPIKASDLYQDDGAIERAIKQLQALAGEHEKVLAGVKKEAIELQVNVKKLNATTADQREEISRSAKQAEELEKRYQKYNDSLTQNARDIAAVQVAQTKLNQVNRAEAQLAIAKEGSYNALSAQYSLLKLRINQMTRAERENTEEGRNLVKQSREIYEEMKRLQEETGKTSLNVGNYKESIKDALRETGFFPGALGQVVNQLSAVRNALLASTAAIQGANKALRFFKIALAATGIGAIVLVLGSLIAMLTRTQNGIDLVNRVMAGFKAVADVFVDRLSAIGEALRSDFVGTLKEAGSRVKDFFGAVISGDYASFIAQTAGAANAVKGFAGEIKEEFDASMALVGALQQVRDETQALEVRTARARAEIKRLNLVAEDTTQGYADRAAAAERAGAIERSLLADRQALLERELSLLEQQKALGNSLFDDEQELADKRREIAQVQTESLELQTTINNKLNTINQAAAASAAKLRDELAEAAATLGGPAEQARLEYDRALAKIEELRREAERLKQAFDFSPLETLAAAQYERAIDKTTLSAKALAVEGLQPLASITAQARDSLSEIREIVSQQGQALPEGLKISKEGVDALKGAFGQAKAQVAEFFQQQTQLADFQLQQAQHGVQAAQEELQIQLQSAAAGYASRVETAQAELALARQKEEEAQRIRQRAQRQQLLAQSIEQASNLVTAISKLFATLPFFLALPTSALLFGTFAAAKAKAFQATKIFREGGYEVLEGGSHASGNDIPLYTGRDRVQLRAEGGEGMAIFSRRAVREYGSILPGLVQAVNTGSLEAKIDSLNHATDSLAQPGVSVNVNTRGVESRLDALRRDGKRKTYTNSRGQLVEVIGNRKITYV